MSYWLKLVILEGNCPRTGVGASPVQIASVQQWLRSNELRFRTLRPSVWHPEWCLMHVHTHVFHTTLCRGAKMLSFCLASWEIKAACGWLCLMKGGRVSLLLPFESVSLAAMAWQWWTTHPPTRWTSLFQQRASANEASKQTWIRLVSYFVSFPFCHFHAWRCFRMHQVTAIKRPLSAASTQDNMSPRAVSVALLLWVAANCWHRRRRFVSIKHKHPDVHFSGLNSRQIFQGQPFSSLIPARF